MSSQAQIEANQRNAQQSTGPKSERGKASSRKNALRHGLLARVASLPEVDQTDFVAILEALTDLWHPQGAEILFVHELAVVELRARREFQVESETFHYFLHDAEVHALQDEQTRVYKDAKLEGDSVWSAAGLRSLRDQAVKAAQRRDEHTPLARAFVKGAKTFEALARYRAANAKERLRLIQLLREMQALHTGCAPDLEAVPAATPARAATVDAPTVPAIRPPQDDDASGASSDGTADAGHHDRSADPRADGDADDRDDPCDDIRGQGEEPHAGEETCGQPPDDSVPVGGNGEHDERRAVETPGWRDPAPDTLPSLADVKAPILDPRNAQAVVDRATSRGTPTFEDDALERPAADDETGTEPPASAGGMGLTAERSAEVTRLLVQAAKAHLRSHRTAEDGRPRMEGLRNRTVLARHIQCRRTTRPRLVTRIQRPYHQPA